MSDHEKPTDARQVMRDIIDGSLTLGHPPDEIVAIVCRRWMEQPDLFAAFGTRAAVLEALGGERGDFAHKVLGNGRVRRCEDWAFPVEDGDTDG